jgi:hypothetical protein
MRTRKQSAPNGRLKTFAFGLERKESAITRLTKFGGEWAEIIGHEYK